MEFSASSGNLEWRPSTPLGLGIFKGWLGCSRAARCVRIVKISCVVQGIQLVLQILNLSQEDSVPAAQESSQFSIVWLYLFLAADTS